MCADEEACCCTAEITDFFKNKIMAILECMINLKYIGYDEAKFNYLNKNKKIGLNNSQFSCIIK